MEIHERAEEIFIKASSCLPEGWPIPREAWISAGMTESEYAELSAYKEACFSKYCGFGSDVSLPNPSPFLYALLNPRN